MQKLTKRLFASALTAIMAVTAAGPAYAGDVSPDLRLRGSVVTTWSFVNPTGLYYVPVTQDGSFEQIPGASIVAEYGAYDDGEGRYYVGWLEDWGVISFPHITIYSTDTWEEIDWPDCDHSILCTDNATDPTTGDVYGCFYHYDDIGNPALAWAKADYKGGQSQPIRLLDEAEQMFGVACDAAGQYYGVLADGSLVKVDKSTGAFTKIGDTGLRPYYSTSATFDDKSGNLIFSYAPATGKSSLWTIDPADASATLLVEYVENEQITALEVVRPEADDLAPAAPLLTADAPQGEMELTYSITMPTTLFNGTPATGALRWTLTVDGTEAATGTSTFGATVEGSVTLADTGMHTVIAYVENEVGRSPRAKATVVNGTGTPAVPTGLVLNNFGDGEIALFWDNVTTSADGAYIDPAAVTYTVLRNGETVAEGLQEPWVEDKVEIPSTYVKLTYEVMACYADNRSEAAVATTGVGAITPPYRSHLAESDTEKDSDLYILVNSNDDAGTWWFSPSYGSFIYDYSTENDADDWLISPAFYLEEGKTYELSYSVAGNSKLYTERYAVAMGVAPVAPAMITELLPPTEISTERLEPIEMRLTVQPKSTGNYYFGWHALSDAGMFQIHLSGIRLSVPMTATSPAEATDLTLLRDPDGYLRLTGTFKAPATDISGHPLAGLSLVSVTREGKDTPVAEFTSAAPGATLEFTDPDIPEAGKYTYHITSMGADGAPGRDVSMTAYVGPYAPVNVPSVSLVETSTPGRVVLSWDAPTEDISGHPLIADHLRYMVYVAGEYGMAEPLFDAPVTERTLTLDVCSPEEMEFAVFYLSALNMGVECDGLTRSPMLPVGKAETLPYLHSFTESDIEAHLLGYVAPAGTYGSLAVGSREENNIPAADGDDAFLVARQYEADATLDFFTGKIDLTAAPNPALTMRHYKWSDSDANRFTIYAITADGKRVELAEVDHAEGCATGWNVTVCPLGKVKGTVVQLAVNTLFHTHDTMAFDALAIADMPDYDLAATSISVPARVEPAKEFAVSGSVVNMGVRCADTYSVELLVNGEPVQTIPEGAPLESGESAEVAFSHTLSPLTSGDVEMAIRVHLEADGNAANDVSPAATPQLVESKFPAVADLTATAVANGVELRWSAPSTEGYALNDTEDFEASEPWTEEVEGWTMLDLDGEQIGTLEGASMPEGVAMRTSHSFFVFDSASDDIFFYNPALAYLVTGHSGSRSLAAMYILKTSVPQDDWAISPLLSGEAQTISFYARSFHPEYPDHMEVLYAMKDAIDPAAFTSLCGGEPFEVPQLVDAVGNAMYQEYKFDLPAGAKRFALRAYNEGGNGFMLMIDDVTFKQANAELEVRHYDVYRDGLCVNAQPVTATSYTDTAMPDGAHTYNVVVAYNRGLSGASNPADVTTSGIDEILASGISVRVERGLIIVSGAPAVMPVRLHTSTGQLLHSGAGDCRIPASAGIHLLTLGDRTVKVLVK